MNLALFALAIELRSWTRHLRLSCARAYVWCALLALYVQGALYRAEDWEHTERPCKACDL